MQIIQNSKVQEKLYIEKLENGLTIMIIPKKHIQKKSIIIATNYGSIDNKFIAPGEEEITNIPDGVAHFLEHKMFEQENGTNSLDTLTALGVMANAYTTNNYTAYLFECTDNFYEALDELMDYVQHPYFTDKNVEKEKGIIGQEIMMYEDYPEWAVYMNAIKNMYKMNPINKDIAGSIESIKEINKEILYKCYNTFYNLSNMAVVVSGDFEPESLIKEIEKRLIAKESKGEIKRIYEEEPEEIVNKMSKVKMEVSMPIFAIGIKDKIDTQNSIIKKHIAIEILLNLIIGKSSDLYKKLYESQILKSELELEYDFYNNYAYIMITGQSKDPDKVLEEFKNELINLKNSKINEEDFIRIKNMLYGTYIKEFNSVTDIVRMFITDYFKGINSFDYFENYNQVTKDYIEQILKDVFVEEKMTISIVRGNK